MPAVHAELPPLIPRETLFGNPERVSPQISPDGKRLAWIAPNTNNVLQVWVKTVGQKDDNLRSRELFDVYRLNLKTGGLVLIGEGANNPRVKQAESEQIVAAIEKNGGKVIYALYPEEGHGFARPENRIDFNARAEAFLAQNLGGRAEPVQGDKYPGSTAVVKVIGR